MYGWERANWFAPKNYQLTESDLNRDDTLGTKSLCASCGWPNHEKNSFRRSNYFDFVDKNVVVQSSVGILDMSAFSKASVEEGFETWLNSILANKVPSKPGRIALCHMLSLNGGTS